MVRKIKLNEGTTLYQYMRPETIVEIDGKQLRYDIKTIINNICKNQGIDYIQIGESSILKNGFTLNIENTIKNKTFILYVEALTDSNSNICFQVTMTEDVWFAKPLYKSKVYTITELEESMSECVSIIDTFKN